jgi:hypothetical protein
MGKYQMHRDLMAQMGCFYVRYMDDWVSQFWILDCEEI